MWIENVSKVNVEKGFHHDAGPNSMVIRIQDPGVEFKPTKHAFKEEHRFEFLDIEEDGMTNLGEGVKVDVSEFGITQRQAEDIVMLLRRAYFNRMNVVVHCHAGLCRSGAVAEVGVEFGFVDVGNARSPNLLVKSSLRRALGWTYDSTEKPYHVRSTNPNAAPGVVGFIDDEPG